MWARPRALAASCRMRSWARLRRTLALLPPRCSLLTLVLPFTKMDAGYQRCTPFPVSYKHFCVFGGLAFACWGGHIHCKHAGSDSCKAVSYFAPHSVKVLGCMWWVDVSVQGRICIAYMCAAHGQAWLVLSTVPFSLAAPSALIQAQQQAALVLTLLLRTRAERPPPAGRRARGARQRLRHRPWLPLPRGPARAHRAQAGAAGRAAQCERQRT